MKTVKLAQIEPGIRVLTLDRGASRNALSRQLLAAHWIRSRSCESAAQ